MTTYQVSRHIKLTALEMDAKGHGQGDIAATLGIGVDTLTRAKRNMRNFGDVEAPKKKRGRKSKMDLGMQEVHTIVQYVFQVLILIVTYCIYSTSTGGGFEVLYIIFREDVYCAPFRKCIVVLSKESWYHVESGLFSLKLLMELTLKLAKEARERDEVLRARWIVKLSEWREDQLIFIDESGVNSKLGERVKGWCHGLRDSGLARLRACRPVTQIFRFRLVLLGTPPPSSDP